MKAAPRQQGFVLLMVLVLIMLAAVLLTGTARRTITMTTAAHRAGEDLQRRWGAASLERLLVQDPEKLLAEAKLADAKPARQRWHTCELGGMAFDIVVTDEQAKANMNQLYRGDRQTTMQALRELLTHDGSVPATIRLRLPPAAAGAPGAAAANARHPGRFFTFDQVLEGATAQAIVGDRQRAGIADTLTFWGDGRLHLQRASDEAIRAVCLPMVGRHGSDLVIEARNDDPRITRESLAQHLAGISPEHKTLLLAAFTDESKCHGFWIIARGPTRSWHRLVVREQLENDHHIHRFDW